MGTPWPPTQLSLLHVDIGRERIPWNNPTRQKKSREKDKYYRSNLWLHSVQVGVACLAVIAVIY